MKHTRYISVIIPTYNNHDSIIRTVHSVLSQSYQDIEIIVVDDGSEDNTLELVKNIDDNRIRSYHLPHRNANCARNYGINVSKGEFIAMLDADDYWLPNHLESSVKLLNATCVDGICGYPILEKSQNLTRIIPPSRKLKENESIINYLLSTGCGAQTSTLFMTAQSAKAILWDELLNRHQDYDFVTRYSKKFQWEIKLEPTVVYTLSEKEKKIDFTSCIRFIEQNKYDIDPIIYKAYHQNMLSLALKQHASDEIVKYYQYEFSRYNDLKELAKIFANELIQKTHSTTSYELYNGKVGISLTLFEVARLLNDEKMQDYAFQLIQEALEYSGNELLKQQKNFQKLEASHSELKSALTHYHFFDENGRILEDCYKIVATHYSLYNPQLVHFLRDANLALTSYEIILCVFSYEHLPMERMEQILGKTRSTLNKAILRAKEKLFVVARKDGLNKIGSLGDFLRAKF